MTSKSPSRRAFLLSTLFAMPTLRRRRTGDMAEKGERRRQRQRQRLGRLAARYGSELGELRKVGR